VSNPLKYLNKPVTAFTTKLSARSPVLQSTVQVSEAFDPQSGNPPPIAQPYIATWDTGATNTVITSKVATELGLKPSGKVKVRGVGPAGVCQEHDSNTYLVNIFLPNNVGLAGVRVSENAVDGCDVLIGMDVITTGDLAITNHNGKTTFSFRVPPCEEIDFVAEITEHNRRVGGGRHTLTIENQRKLKNKRKAMRKKNR
jgi:gag-polyprotein putative aspartyl protease